METDFKSLAREMAGRERASKSLIMIVITLFVATAVYWASWATLDNVTRGEGRIISSVQNQRVQAAEGGVILRRFVAENSDVEEGEVLFEIDPVDASSELNRLTQRLSALDIKELRLRAEIDRTAMIVPQELRVLSPTVAISEENLFLARRDALSGRLEVLDQRLKQREQDLIAAEHNEQTAERTAVLLEDEIAVVEPLVREKIAPATRLLELERQLERARGDQANAEVLRSQASLAIDEIETEIANTLDDYSLQAIDELNSVVAEQSELSEALPSLKERVSRTLIRAPMDGIVNQLNFRTPGGYVNKGDVVVDIVPTGESLIVEAKIAPKDISRIRVDDDVRIRLSAYDSSKYGTLDGRVVRISPDAVVDERNQDGGHFMVDVAIESELFLEGADEPVSIIPGMTATIDVLSGKRTVLEYFWQPISKVQELALRD